MLEKNMIQQTTWQTHSFQHIILYARSKQQEARNISMSPKSNPLEIQRSHTLHFNWHTHGMLRFDWRNRFEIEDDFPDGLVVCVVDNRVLFCSLPGVQLDFFHYPSRLVRNKQSIPSNAAQVRSPIGCISVAWHGTLPSTQPVVGIVLYCGGRSDTLIGRQGILRLT